MHCSDIPNLLAHSVAAPILKLCPLYSFESIPQKDNVDLRFAATNDWRLRHEYEEGT